ncbi:MAG: hypothetical protein ACRC6V_14745 [Bacteroidales bacterium]
MANFFGGLMDSASSLFGEDDKKKKVSGALAKQELPAEPEGFSLGDVTSYFKPTGKVGEAMVSGPNSLTASGEGPSTMQKAKGAVGSLFDMGEQDLGALYAGTDFEDTANDELLGVIADEEGAMAAAAAEEGVDWEAFSRMLQTIKPTEHPKINMSTGRVGGGFQFNRKPYENQLLVREYENLYNQPLYNKLT